MTDQFDLPGQNGDLLAEAELTMTLMIAAREAEHQLPQGEIDNLLGITPRCCKD